MADEEIDVTYLRADEAAPEDAHEPVRTLAESVSEADGSAADPGAAVVDESGTSHPSAAEVDEEPQIDLTAAEVDEDGLTADDPGIAGSRARRPAAEVSPPGGFVGSLKFAWAVLTSMRTAIILLLLLAVAAIPGGILPQRPVNPFAVTTYLADHTTIGPLLDKIRMFDV
jgi:hypothetical protein